MKRSSQLFSLIAFCTMFFSCGKKQNTAHEPAKPLKPASFKAQSPVTPETEEQKMKRNRVATRTEWKKGVKISTDYYNENGQLVKNTFYNHTGSHHILYRYNKNGLLAQKEETYALETYAYDTNGNRIHELHQHKGEERLRFSQEIFMHYKNDRLHWRFRVAEVMSDKFVYHYDQGGTQTGWDMYYKGMNNEWIRERSCLNEYDSITGLLVREKHKGIHTHNNLSWTFEVSYKYNDRGDCIEKNLSEQSLMGGDYWYEYDEKGLKVKVKCSNRSIQDGDLEYTYTFRK